jgi:hypothetical protein
VRCAFDANQARASLDAVIHDQQLSQDVDMKATTLASTAAAPGMVRWTVKDAASLQSPPMPVQPAKLKTVLRQPVRDATPGRAKI